jgi:hypothetical protein
MNWPDYIAVGAFGFALVHAIYKGLYQARDARKLAERELRWKQSEQARSVLDELEDDEYANAAMLLLDWDGREVSIAGHYKVFTHKQVDKALRTTDTNFDEDEVVIRDCYDHFFYSLERISLWIEVELISVYDVVFPIGYLAGCMAKRRPVFEGFMCEYDYSRSLRLMKQFESWGGALLTSSTPPEPKKPTVNDFIREILLNVELPSKLELANRNDTRDT